MTEQPLTDVDRAWIRYMGDNARANREYHLHPATSGRNLCIRCGRTTNAISCNRADCVE